jgi:hypothetical protein
MPIPDEKRRTGKLGPLRDRNKSAEKKETLESDKKTGKRIGGCSQVPVNADPSDDRDVLCV